MLSGCATNGLFDGFSNEELLQPWVELSGGQVSLPSGALKSDYIVFRRPTAISVRGNDLYLVDAGLRRIFRYDRFQQTLTPFATSVPVESETAILAAPDQTVYITVPSLGKVAHLTREGILLPTLESPGNLARPISVAVDEHSGNVYVVDGLYNHIVTFTGLGSLVSIITPEKVRSISAIAIGSGGIYVIDDISKQVVMLDLDGYFRYSLGVKFPSEPGSIAVDGNNLLFMSDNYDNSVKVYSLKGFGKSSMVGGVGGIGGQVSESYNGIGSLAVEDETLFIADSLNSRIQTLLINSNAKVVGR